VPKKEAHQPCESGTNRKKYPNGRGPTGGVKDKGKSRKEERTSGWTSFGALFVSAEKREVDFQTRGKKKSLTSKYAAVFIRKKRDDISGVEGSLVLLSGGKETTFRIISKGGLHKSFILKTNAHIPFRKT